MCAGRGEVFLVGGTESMSKYPLQYSDAATAKFAKLAKARTLGQRVSGFLKFRPKDLFVPRITLMLGLTDPVCSLAPQRHVIDAAVAQVEHAAAARDATPAFTYRAAPTSRALAAKG